jgi:hypothetical protein
LLDHEEGGEEQTGHQHEVFGGIAEEHFECETDHAEEKGRWRLRRSVAVDGLRATRDAGFNPKTEIEPQISLKDTD